MISLINKISIKIFDSAEFFDLILMARYFHFIGTKWSFCLLLIFIIFNRTIIINIKFILLNIIFIRSYWIWIIVSTFSFLLLSFRIIYKTRRTIWPWIKSLFSFIYSASFYSFRISLIFCKRFISCSNRG
jgi:hypothetical protein